MKKPSLDTLTLGKLFEEWLQHLDVAGDLLPSPTLTSPLFNCICNQLVATAKFPLMWLFLATHGRVLDQG